MNGMNLLPEELRSRPSGRGEKSPAFRLLIGTALLLAVGYAFLTVQITRLEARIEAGCARLDTLTAPSGTMEGIPETAELSGERRLIQGVVDSLDQCVPPEVIVTGLKVVGNGDALTAEGRLTLSPPPEMVEITGVSASGRSIGRLVTALEHAGRYSAVELSSLSRREDGEFAFTVLGRLSI